MPKKPSKRRSPSQPPSLEELMASHLSQAMDQMFQAVMERFLGPQHIPIPGHTPKPNKQDQVKYNSRDPKPPNRFVYGTLYDVLGVSPQAPQEVIDGAWRALSKKHHPDIKGGSEEMTKRLNGAHDTLSDPQKRKRYDQNIGAK